MALRPYWGSANGSESVARFVPRTDTSQALGFWDAYRLDTTASQFFRRSVQCRQAECAGK
jgi:hypothetical protein